MRARALTVLCCVVKCVFACACVRIGGGGDVVATTTILTLPLHPSLPHSHFFIDYNTIRRSENTPGPGTAAPYAGLGRQLLSTRHSSPAAGFGTGRRLPDYVNDAPGVGSYYA